jgi:hypothetical protein
MTLLLDLVEVAFGNPPVYPLQASTAGRRSVAMPANLLRDNMVMVFCLGGLRWWSLKVELSVGLELSHHSSTNIYTSYFMTTQSKLAASPVPGLCNWRRYFTLAELADSQQSE